MKVTPLLGLMFAIAFFVTPVVPVHAASLTDSQIQSIIGLLSSFGAEQSVINNVNASLRGQIPTSLDSSSSVAGNVSNGCQYIGLLSRTLSEGSSGSDVSALQRFLQAQGFFTHPTITVYFGPATESAVQRWQTQHDVVSSGVPETTGYGVVGSLTRAAIGRVCGTSSTSGQTSTAPHVEPASTEQDFAEARDIKRISDLRQLQLALELYFDAHRSYPISLSLLAPNYVAIVRADPKDGSSYLYDQLDSGSWYELAANLETNHTALSHDFERTRPGGNVTSFVDQLGCKGEGGRHCYNLGDFPLESGEAPMIRSASIDASSLTTTSSNPVISGSASGITGVSFLLTDGTYKIYDITSSNIPVTNGRWSFYLSASPLSSGTYYITVSAPDGEILSNKTLVVDSSAATTGEPHVTVTIATPWYVKVIYENIPNSANTYAFVFVPENDSSTWYHALTTVTGALTGTVTGNGEISLAIPADMPTGTYQLRAFNQLIGGVTGGTIAESETFVVTK